MQPSFNRNFQTPIKNTRGSVYNKKYVQSGKKYPVKQSKEADNAAYLAQQQHIEKLRVEELRLREAAYGQNKRTKDQRKFSPAIKYRQGDLPKIKANNIFRPEPRLKTSNPIKVTASPPVGNVPDPNNEGNVYICHDTSTAANPDAGFITLSVPMGDAHNYTAPDYDGKCTAHDMVFCPPGSFPDCKGVCNGNAVLDCGGYCYDPDDDAPLNLRDCAGNCYPVGQIPPAVPDCNGVCGGSSFPDCLGVCDGDAVIDCNGVCNGGAYEDCGGNCTVCNNEDECSSDEDCPEGKICEMIEGHGVCKPVVQTRYKNSKGKTASRPANKYAVGNYQTNPAYVAFSQKAKFYEELAQKYLNKQVQNKKTQRRRHYNF